MPSKEIVKEFVIQQGYPENLTPVSFGAWSSFMNTFAVWDFTQGANNTIRRRVSLPAGYYYVVGAADNSGSVNINGQNNISLYGFRDGISRTNIAQNTRIYHGGGIMSITITAVNFGGAPGGGNPAGVAVTISKEKVTFYNYATGMGEGYDRGYISTKDVISVGDLVWSTRTNLTQTDQGRYTVVMPFKAAITAYAWGAGGGAGGDDTDSPFGGPGSPGLYNTTTFTVDPGDTVEVFVGKGGRGGGSIDGSSPGGAGGPSRTILNGNNARSFNGGTGGNSGPSGSGGGGGGGGGASGVILNNVPILVAGGGGGGGGAGDGGAAQGQITIASINNNAIGQTPSDYRGENGQIKSGNGGGGGAGGGGYPGGQGGATVSGDKSAAAGQCGGNFPIYSAATGTNTQFYKSGFSAGGPRASGNGQNGRVVIEIAPIGLAAVKVDGAWKQINQAYTKVGGSWKSINSIFVKVADSWKPVTGVGAAGDFDLVLTSGNYSTVNRPYIA